MKYAVEMGTCAVIYVPCFIRICTGVQAEVRGETHTEPQNARWSHELIFIL
jgi:hypothetical protein